VWLAIFVSLAYIVTYIGINISVGAHGIDIIRNVVSGILYGQKREVFVYVAVDFCAVAIIAGAIAGWKVFRFLEAPALVAVGQASYGGYLLHPIALMTIAYIVGVPVGEEPVYIRVVLFILAWCCTVALARASYTMFERRFIRIGHRISNRILLRARGGAAE
jgi:peptidoglycan/LPS O-acetylase OafA/YrhL